MSIANRILAGFAAATILMVALGLFGLSQIGVVREATETIVSRDLAFIRQVSVVRDGQQKMQAAGERVLSDGLLRGQAQGSQEALTRWRAQQAVTERALGRALDLANQYRDAAVSADRAQAWGRIAELLGQASTQFQTLIKGREAQLEALAQGRTADAAAMRGGLDAALGDFERQIEAIDAALDQSVLSGQERVRQVYELSRMSTLAGLALAVGVAIIVAYLIRQSIVGPLHVFMSFVEQVGRGDLTGQAPAGSRDEIGTLGRTLNGMVDGLKDLARQSREATENLNAATAEIRASTQEQAASVEEQLAAVQETAATVDEITHSGAQISKRAQEVIASAQATAQTSNDGLRAVDETTRAMDAIRDQAEAVAQNIVALSEKTQAIGEIIATVNDISERSHLLALNAAIEAASAGENGRSFSVVASEMKMLADQAKDATAQVRSILGDIQRGINASVMLTEEAVKRVAAGKERTDTTQRTITEITGRVQESVQTFQQIVASTNQQQLGIEQVMGALQNIRQASQQTAAGTRQLDDAAANLSDLSRQLLTLSERYRT